MVLTAFITVSIYQANKKRFAHSKPFVPREGFEGAEAPRRLVDMQVPLIIILPSVLAALPEAA